MYFILRRAGARRGHLLTANGAADLACQERIDTRKLKHLQYVNALDHVA
jgi:hypothetical protein